MKLTDKVLNALPTALQGRLKKPKLRNLTFGDLKIVGDQLDKFKKQSKAKKDKEWEQKACTACIKLH